MMYGFRGGYGEFSGLGWLWMIVGMLVLVGLVLLAAWLVTRASRGQQPPQQPPQQPWQPMQPPTGAPSRPTPNEILRERFARGEITAEEFERAKTVLGPDN